MTLSPDLIRAKIIRSDFHMFVQQAFYEMHGQKIDDQPYVQQLCFRISELIERKSNRLLINLPPQHLKSFIGSVCTSAYLLGIEPRLRILLVTYSSALAESLCEKIRGILQSDWYQRAFATRLKEGHSRKNDFATNKNGGVFATAATGNVTGRPADFLIADDPHDAYDWNNEEKLSRVRTHFSTLLARMNDPVNGTGPGHCSPCERERFICGFAQAKRMARRPAATHRSAKA